MARPPWSDLPASVRAGVEDLLGFPVVRAEPQGGGFSPGVAARVRGQAGQRAFVKAVD
nr:aminoglycoside phosphotransferase family protein [Actinomycetota bacterium]